MSSNNMSKKKKLEFRRLVLAKKLFLHGCRHASNKDSISRMLAIHHFDNSVEMVLKCIATKYEVVSSSKEEFRFKDLSNEIIRKGLRLPLKTQMFALHDVRNLVQHQGDIPSIETVVKYKGYTQDFFETVTNEIFSVSFKDLYLFELIENEKVREESLKAEKAFGKGEYIQSIEFCDEALRLAMFKETDIFYLAGKLTGLFGASDEFKLVINKDYTDKYKDKDFYEPVRELSRAVAQLGRAATTMQFLGDYRSEFLEYFQKIDRLDDLSDKELKDCAEFSLEFSFSLLLKMQEDKLFEKEKNGDIL